MDLSQYMLAGRERGWISAGDIAGDSRRHTRVDPDGPGESGPEVGRHYLHVLAWLRCLHHESTAKVDGNVRDVRRRGRVGVVEEQVAGLEISDGNPRSGLRLAGSDARHDDPRLPHRPLHQA